MESWLICIPRPSSGLLYNNTIIYMEAGRLPYCFFFFYCLPLEERKASMESACHGCMHAQAISNYSLDPVACYVVARPVV